MTDLDTLKKQAFEILGTGNTLKAETLLRRTQKMHNAEVQDIIAPAEPNEHTAHLGIMLTLRGIAWLLQEKTDDALKALLKARELLARAAGAHAKKAASVSADQVLTLTALSRVMLLRNQISESAALSHEAEALLNQAMPEHDIRTAAALFTLSMSSYAAGRMNEAEARILRAMNIWKTLHGNCSTEIAVCLNNIGRICEESGRIDQGIAWHRKALAMKKKLLGIHHETAFSMGNLGTALASAGEWKEASEMLKEALACYAACGQTDGAHITGYRRNLSICMKALSKT